MKLLLSAALLLGMLVTGPAARDYEVTRWLGDHDFLFDFRGEAQLALGPAQGDALSAWQRLPFEWSFFGDEVDGYFISDNGYITFNREAKVTMGGEAAPSQSIFAFYSDVRLGPALGQWDGRVWTATLGQAPNRVHLIYWLSVGIAPDTSGRYNFALALYENESFEVIFTSAQPGGSVEGFAGARGIDGPGVVAVDPRMPFPAVSFGGDDDVNYLFRPVEG